MGNRLLKLELLAIANWGHAKLVTYPGPSFLRQSSRGQLRLAEREIFPGGGGRFVFFPDANTVQWVLDLARKGYFVIERPQ
jgi:hypothetical protein